MNWWLACDNEGSVYYCLPSQDGDDLTDGPTVRVSARGVSEQLGQYGRVLSNDAGVYGVALDQDGNLHVTPLERGTLPEVPAFAIPRPFPKDAVDIACSDNGQFWALEGHWRPDDDLSLEAMLWPEHMLAVWDCRDRAFTRAGSESDIADDGLDPVWVTPGGRDD